MQNNDLSKIRHENLGGDLDISYVNSDPVQQFSVWMQLAIAAEIEEPAAMTLATVTTDGQPSARMVLLKGFDENGFVFFTNYESRKGREIAKNHRVALVFYWKELGRLPGYPRNDRILAGA
jgi:pyridoxamine 5'-phosphate oxidase